MGSDTGARLDDRLAGELERLTQAASGGRVAHTGFLEPDGSARLVSALAGRGVQARAWGGFPGARRRVVTAFPTHVPEASTPLAALYLAGLGDPGSTRAALQAAGLPAELLGDAVAHQEGVSLVVVEPVERRLLALTELEGRPVAPSVVPLERAVHGSLRRVGAVVPSLRVDVLGAKGFRVSRSYFAKGVAGGKVSVNGRPAGKSSSAEAGDEIYAEGLGRLRVLSVDGETRRGNVRVTMEVEAGGAESG
jgi:RNA-binding protein YlmH